MESTLYLLNDSIHTFDEVISTLRKHFGYSLLHGTSIASIVHQNGRCGIKNAYFEELEPLKESLMHDGFNVTIENKI